MYTNSSQDSIMYSQLPLQNIQDGFLHAQAEKQNCMSGKSASSSLK